MADLETKVKVTADAAGLKKIGEESKKAFDARRPRELRQATKDLQRDLVGLARTQADLAKALSGTDRGTRAYKDLGRELKTVSREADTLRRVLKEIERTQDALTGKGGRRGPPGPAQAFGRGLFGAIGFGGMGGGGAMVGGQGGGAALAALAYGLGRRTWQGATSPFLMPGVSGMAAGISAVPVIGPAIAGLMQAGQGYVQQATAFSGARLENLPYADLGARGRLRTHPGYGRAEQQFLEASRMRAGLEMAAPHIRTAMDATLGGATGARLVRQVASQGAMTVGLLGRGLMEGGVSNIDPGSMAKWIGKEMRKPGQAKELVKFGKEMAGYTDPTENWLRAARAAEAAAARRVAKQAKYVREDATGIPGAGFGASMGFAPEEMQQFFGSLMGARGGRSSHQFLWGGVREAMAAKRMYGVSPELSGRFFRMATPTGGGSEVSLQYAVQSGVAIGLSGSHISEYLSTLVDQGKEIEASGIKFDTKALIQNVQFTRALGFDELQAVRVAGGIGGAGRRLAERGVQSPMDVLLMRAAGYSPEQGAEGYATAQEKLESMNPAMIKGLLGAVTEGAGGGGWGPKMQALMVKRAMGRMGVKIGMKQAEVLIGGFQGGQLSPNAQKEFEAIQLRAEEGGLVEGGIAGSARMGGLKVAAASLQAEQIGVGGRLAGTFFKLDRAGVKAVSALADFNKQLMFGANIVHAAMSKLKQFTEVASGGDLMAAIMGAFVGVGTGR